MGDEIELKLELTLRAADLIEASGLWSGSAEILAQRSIYFDAPDHALAKAGLWLRVRHSRGGWVQTVKADGASTAGLFARAEWEFPVAGDTPVLDDRTPVAAALGEATDAIAPIFDVLIERRRSIVEQDGAVIEVALDRGEAVAGERITPICELELELKRGDPAALFALARRIDAVAPVRLEVLSKAERGYRLSAEAPAMVKAGPVVLPGASTAAQAFGRIVQASIRQFRLNEALLQAGRNPAALHQARVALRRLRSGFATFKPIVAGAAQAHLAAELRWLACELGNARNLDVLLDRVGPGGLHDRLAAARDAAYARVEEVLGEPRVRTLMLDLAAWTFSGDWTRVPALAPERDEPVRELAGRALDRFHRKVIKGGRHLETIDDEARHQLRKDAKKLRYASDFFASVFGRKRERRRYRKFVAALEALQDQLGALNDLATAPQLLATLGIAPDAAPLAEGANRAKLLKHAARAHAELHERKRYWR